MSRSSLIPASDDAAWRAALAPFSALDPSFLAAYHRAYSLRITHSKPFLWQFHSGSETLIYPFLLTPIILDNPTEYYDISSIYGYTGPMSTSHDKNFLTEAWTVFDAFAREQKVIAEFVRFCPPHDNQNVAHPEMSVSENRTLAASFLPETEEELLAKLGSKTRNMLRKAEKNGLTARELSITDSLSAFRKLYDATMDRNSAPDFFLYDDAYYAQLTSLAPNELRLFGTFLNDELVAASMAVINDTAALYHLGASMSEYAKLGAGNLSLFEMSRCLMRSGVRFINMTGGRSTRSDDPLLLFKKSNATDTTTFYIGKRVIDATGYEKVRARFQTQHDRAPDAEKIIFWR